MLNKKPVFIVGFQHGGTNIVLNLLRSHPELCSPRGEFQEVFKGKGFPKRLKEPLRIVSKKLWNYLPILVQQREDVFSLTRWAQRRPLTKRAMAHIDNVLFEEKLRARGDTQNRYRTEGVEYSDEEIRAARLLCKNLNGLIYLSSELSRMYPDATFIALVRNGYALCEGHIRRGVDAELISTAYAKGCERMIEDSETLPNYYIFRFEDLIETPREVFGRICECADLDITKIDKVRLENKKTITSTGEHVYLRNENKEGLIWYSIDEFMSHFKSDINRNQIDRLSREQIDIISRNAGHVLRHFSYPIIQ